MGQETSGLSYDLFVKGFVLGRFMMPLCDSSVIFHMYQTVGSGKCCSQELLLSVPFDTSLFSFIFKTAHRNAKTFKCKNLSSLCRFRLLFLVFCCCRLLLLFILPSGVDCYSARSVDSTINTV